MGTIPRSRAPSEAISGATAHFGPFQQATRNTSNDEDTFADEVVDTGRSWANDTYENGPLVAQVFPRVSHIASRVVEVATAKAGRDR